MTDIDKEVHHNIGRHDAQIEALQRQLDALHLDLQAMNLAIANIQTTLSEAKGGWRTLMWVSGASASIGVMATKFIAWLTTVPGPK